MAIAMAQQKGNSVYVYDESNRTIFIKQGELHGYTSSTVTVRRGNALYLYDENGRGIGVRNC